MRCSLPHLYCLVLVAIPPGNNKKLVHDHNTLLYCMRFTVGLFTAPKISSYSYNKFSSGGSLPYYLLGHTNLMPFSPISGAFSLPPLLASCQPGIMLDTILFDPRSFSMPSDTHQSGNGSSTHSLQQRRSSPSFFVAVWPAQSGPSMCWPFST